MIVESEDGAWHVVGPLDDGMRRVLDAVHRCGRIVPVGAGEGSGAAGVDGGGVARRPAGASSRYARRRRVRLAPERDVSRLYNPPLQVVGFLGTTARRSGAGPQVRIRGDEAALRMLIGRRNGLDSGTAAPGTGHGRHR